MTALETLNWHESKAEASDETIRSQRSRFELVEKRPAPLVMNDKEMLDWLDEYADSVTQSPTTRQHSRTFTIKCDLISPTRGESLRDAVQLAAAKLEEQS